MQRAYLPSKFVAFLLGFFLGGLGIHRIYLGAIGPGIVWFIVSLLSIVGGIWPISLLLMLIGAFQGISYLFWSKENWARKYTRVTGLA